MTSLPSFPTPPDAPTPPDEYAGLRAIVAKEEDSYPVLYPGHMSALASLLRAYEGMRADAERWRWIKPYLVVDGDVADHSVGAEGWAGLYIRAEKADDEGGIPLPVGTGYYRDPNDAADAARASAPDSEVRDG